MRRVLIYRSALGATSEPFIAAQAGAMTRWRPRLVGEAVAAGGALPGGLDCIQLAGGRARRWRSLRRQAALCFGRPLGSDVRRLRREAASLWHAHFATDAVEAWPLARELGLPMLVTLHGFDVCVDPDYWESGAGGWLMKRYPTRLRALAEERRVGFVAVSEAIARRALDWGIEPSKIVVRHIGVDTARMCPGAVAPSRRGRRVLFVGRLVEKKGCEHLIRAMSLPALRAAAAELCVIGDGPLRASLERMAADLGVATRFLGACSTAQVKQELDAARALCLPSVTAAHGDAEGFGLVLLEAQACGVPVVSSARGGAEEGLVDGVTGYAVAERDVGRLGERLLALLTDDALLESMSREARDFVVRCFDKAACTAALEAHYDRFLESCA
jgi:glycosyltransferase involved in cell wall biosynthesis